jgi:arsenite methyltransferase
MNTGMAADYLTFSADLSDPSAVAVYDEVSLWSSLFGELLLRHVPLRRNSTVLDVGCGTGFPLLELAQRLGAGSTVYGVDPWEAALDRARQKATQWGLANVALIHGDASALTLADDQVDLIVSNLGINNFADPMAVLTECRRVARPGATLALTTNLQGHMREFYEIYAAVLHDLGKPAAIDRLEAHIEHRATVGRVTDQLEQGQFRVTSVIEEQAVFRFLDGSAFLRHFFIKLGFLDGWKSVLEPSEYTEVFEALEAALNTHADARGELRVTVPMAYIEAM